MTPLRSMPLSQRLALGIPLPTSASKSGYLAFSHARMLGDNFFAPSQTMIMSGLRAQNTSLVFRHLSVSLYLT